MSLELGIIVGSLLAFGVLIFLTYRNGRKAGVDAVRAEVSTGTAEAQDRMAAAGAAGPQDGGETVARLRAGGF